MSDLFEVKKNPDLIDRSVIEDIKAEIEQHRRKTQSIDNYDLVGDCLDIIDKYIKEYEVKIITRGNCMMCGKELDEGLFFCKKCEAKSESEDKG